jgi:ribosomal protein S18 acetylase RimI-like enzyme
MKRADSMFFQNAREQQVLIRPAKLADCGRLAQLCTQLGYPADATTVELRLQKNVDNEKRATFVAEDSSGQVVGFIDMDFRCIMVSDKSAEICGLVVDEHRRGQGFGKALIRQAEAWAAKSGAKVLSLRSNVTRKEAHACYESLGFELAKQAYVFAKELG